MKAVFGTFLPSEFLAISKGDQSGQALQSVDIGWVLGGGIPCPMQVHDRPEGPLAVCSP